MQVGGALSILVVPIQMRYGWRASFYVFALLGVVWAVVWFLWFRNTPAEKRGVTRMVKKLEWTEMAQVATILFPVWDLLKYYPREVA